MTSPWADAGHRFERTDIPLHEQLRETLKEKITGGVLVPGDMIPPELELCRMYGVSRTTARRALLDLTQEGLLRRIPGQGTFVERSRPADVKLLALICPFLDWYMPDLIEGIEKSVKAEGYELIVRNSEKKADVEARQIDEVASIPAAGIILWPKTPDFAAPSSETMKKITHGSIPVVVVDQMADDIDAVTTDSFGGVYLLTEHLVASGRSRIGFVSHQTSMAYTLKQRWEGLQEAARNAGRPSTERLLFNEWPDKDAFGDWVRSEAVDALICANDLIALDVIEALTELGRSVPDDIAVCGFDDIPLARSAHPPLTTVRQDIRAMGQSAGRLLVDRIRNPARPPRHIVLPVRLQIRASCGSSVPDFTAVS